MKNTKSNSSVNLWQRYAVIVVTLFIIALSPAFAEQIASGVSFAQVSFTASNPPEKYSHYGQISVDFTMLYGEGYINVERYKNGHGVGWVVKNLPVVNGTVLSGFSTMFDLGSAGYQSSMTAYVDFSSTPLADDSSLNGRTPVTYRLGQADYAVSAPSDDQGIFNGRLGILRVRISQPCRPGLRRLTWNNLNPKTITARGSIIYFCGRNRSGDDWTSLTFNWPLLQDTPALPDDQANFFVNDVPGATSVEFSGTNDGDPGIENGQDFMITIFHAGPNEQVTITPGAN